MTQRQFSNLSVDITQVLKDTENALRDFVAGELLTKLGDEWVSKCGVTQERIENWTKRQQEEGKRQGAGAVEERLLYYADFYDLPVILKKHWELFEGALGKWRRMEIMLEELTRLRDPDAHRRELLPHQKHLILGIGGEIRSALVRYRSKRETASDCFPRFESARDSLGNIWTPASRFGADRTVRTGMTLRPGDSVDFVVTASDPEDLPLEYAIETNGAVQSEWQEEAAFTLAVTDQDIGQIWRVSLYARSSRNYHAFKFHDDSVQFFYTVLSESARA